MAYATARPVVTIQTFNSYMSTDKDALPLPSVMETPIHPNIVTHVHFLVSKNSCQPYAVSTKSWQPDLCRVMGHRPRRGTNLSVPGGRTHRAGQGAFGNSCRGGCKFSAICFDFGKTCGF